MSGSFDDLFGDGDDFVDTGDAFGLREEALQEAEVSSCQTNDGCGGAGIGEVGRRCCANQLTSAVPLSPDTLIPWPR
ncbi:hypothetical protein JMJ94_20250 [Rhodovulum visakhapatnamense]|uniref:Uncharacterized protein n=1 Tax=Rhodovulum visakhapatnamense TaxID=364297 RepID=A0ABS1RL87_9RHOB|nr:hypothetical protein [Rhodovulum visakhapatnamense]MBL3580280.1 hypothetical protein [Rhodovulum visakhapatnamense]